MPPLHIYALALLLGVVHAFSFAPTPSGTVQILVLTTLLALLRISTRPVRVMWLFGVSWFSAGLYWLYFSMHDVGGLPTTLSIALVLLLALCLSAFYAFSIYLWSIWHRRLQSETLSLCVVFPLLWLSAELARGYIFFGGFPWLASGYAQVDNIILKGWFAILGTYGVGMWAAFLSATLLTLILWICKKIKLTIRTALLLCTLSASFFALGLILQGIIWGNNVGNPVSIRIIQPNISQTLKFDREQITKNTINFMEQAQNSTAELTVFPETALPYSWLDLDDSLLQPLQQSLTHQRAVLMGGVGEDEKGYYNSAIWLDSQADMHNPPRYDKNHLLPMGETVPFGFKWLIDAMKIPLGGYEAGLGFTPFLLNTTSGQIRISANICYENEFGEELINAWKSGDDKAPNLWINMTNLGWFGVHNISTAQTQHLHMSRVRTMEMARPMIVATNTGSSANIDASGVVLNNLPADKATNLDVNVQPRQGTTPYIIMGNWPLFIMLALMFSAMLIHRRSKAGL